MSARITTGMVQRNVLADLNRVNDRAHAHAAEDVLGQRDHEARPTIRSTRRARSQLRDVAGRHAAVPAQRPGRAGLAGDRRDRRSPTITDAVQRARELLVQGASDTADGRRRAQAIAKEIDQLHRAVKENANATYGGRYIFAGTATDHAALPAAAPTTPTTARPHAVERQIGPGVDAADRHLAQRRSSARAGGRRRQAARQTSATSSAHLRGRRRRRAAHADIAALDANLDDLLGVRALNGARTEPARGGAQPPRRGRGVDATRSSPRPRTPTWPRRSSTSTPSRPPTRPPCKAGANIVQVSLMDFLR